MLRKLYEWYTANVPTNGDSLFLLLSSSSVVAHPNLVIASGDVDLQSHVLLVTVESVFPDVECLRCKREGLVVFLQFEEAEGFVPDVPGYVDWLLKSKRGLDPEGSVVVGDRLAVAPFQGERAEKGGDCTLCSINIKQTGRARVSRSCTWATS